MHQQCLHCGQPTFGIVCDNCKREVQSQRSERQYRRFREHELQAERSWANARFHPLWFLFVGWWAAVLLLAGLIATSGVPLLLLVFRSVRRFVYHLVGYY